MPEVSVAVKVASELGETPVWSAAESCLYWIDSPAGKIHRFDPATGHDELLPVALEGYLGSIALAEGGGLLVLAGKQLARLAPGSRLLQPLCEVEPGLPDNRPNDGKCDPQGRFWFGTMQKDVRAPTGNLYRWDRERGLRRMDEGFACSNGLGWSPDGATLYFVDTMPCRILAYDFDARSGEIGRRRVFAQISDPAEGLPDGLAVDVEGGVWTAQWDGWCLLRHDAGGRRTHKLELPVPRPTCPVFAGAGLATLYVTSASTDLSDAIRAQAPLSGSLLSLPAPLPGLPAAAALL